MDLLTSQNSYFIISNIVLTILFNKCLLSIYFLLINELSLFIYTTSFFTNCYPFSMIYLPSFHFFRHFYLMEGF